MYDNNEVKTVLAHEFFLPFGGQLNPENRWVVMANLIPWWKVEEYYTKSLKDLNQVRKHSRCEWRWAH